MIVETIDELLNEMMKEKKQPVWVLMPEWMWLISKDYESFDKIEHKDIPMVGRIWGMEIILDNELENSIKLLTKNGSCVKKEIGHSRSEIKRKEITSK